MMIEILDAYFTGFAVLHIFTHHPAAFITKSELILRITHFFRADNSWIHKEGQEKSNVDEDQYEDIHII
jgi:hypothetical protein